jgi:hypothetical protein
MGDKPYNNWGEVKEDIRRWRNANLCCIFIGLLLIIFGAAVEILEINTLTPNSFYLLAIFFALLSIAPHMHVVALKSWYGVESERKNK